MFKSYVSFSHCWILLFVICIRGSCFMFKKQLWFWVFSFNCWAFSILCSTICCIVSFGLGAMCLPWHCWQRFLFIRIGLPQSKHLFFSLGMVIYFFEFFCELVGACLELFHCLFCHCWHIPGCCLISSSAMFHWIVGVWVQTRYLLPSMRMVCLLSFLHRWQLLAVIGYSSTKFFCPLGQ